MGNQVVDNNFSWVIKNFASLQSGKILSNEFVIGGYKWCLRVYPKGDSRVDDSLSLYLQVANSKSLPSGWRRRVNFNLTVVNQLSEKLSVSRGAQLCWFDGKDTTLGYRAMLPLTKLHAKDGGFLVNDELKIVAQVEVLGVIGRLDVLEESEEVTRPLKKVKREDGVECHDLRKETSPLKEPMDVNGFQVLPSQVELVNHIFRKHPDIAVGFPFKSHHMKTSSMNFLLSLIERLCKSLGEFTDEDLVEADTALAMVKSSGFKVDWLEKKLKEIKEKKKEEKIGETRMKELEVELNDFKKNCSDIEAVLEKEKERLKTVKQKCGDIEARLEKEKAKVLATRAASPLTLSDVI